MAAILNNKRNGQGIKNLGINDKKLKNSTIRTKTNLIHRAYHNFYDNKVLSFVTLTYAETIRWDNSKMLNWQNIIFLYFLSVWKSGGIILNVRNI